MLLWPLLPVEVEKLTSQQRRRRPRRGSLRLRDNHLHFSIQFTRGRYRSRSRVRPELCSSPFQRRLTVHYDHLEVPAPTTTWITLHHCAAQRQGGLWTVVLLQWR